MKKIINLQGTLVELDKVKGITINSEGYDVKLAGNIIKIELLNRKEYILNPESQDWELHEMNDEILIEIPYDDVHEEFRKMKATWEYAINDHS